MAVALGEIRMRPDIGRSAFSLDCPPHVLVAAIAAGGRYSESSYSVGPYSNFEFQRVANDSNRIKTNIFELFW